MKRFALLGALVSAMLLSSAVPVAAITSGHLDGTTHPNVALIYFYLPDGRFRCSATLISPTVLVTAAHCTSGVRGKVAVNFAPVVPPGPRASDDTGDGQSNIGYVAPVAGWLTGTAHAHPLWHDKIQLNNLHDVGVVVLDAPYTAAAPAHLAPRNYLAGLANGNGGLNKQTFTEVGYGVFFAKPDSGPQKPLSIADRTRRWVEAVGQNLSSQVLKLAENAKDSRAEGGSCFGDSGGPSFHNGLEVAVTSFGASQFCRSSGGYYRLDIDDARMFLDDYVTLP
ncbi:MAG: trypsin-like serine protease [Chloroflexota bacterium]